jgi:MYXO-CTERM domain-containing protein
MFIGLVTHGVWGSPKELGILIHMDIDQDQETDFFLYLDDFNMDFFRSTLYDTEWNEIEWEALNGYYPVEYDSPFVPVFMADALVFPVSAAAMGLGEGNSRVSFKVEAQWWPYWDHTPWLHYDLAAPALSFNTDTAGMPSVDDMHGGIISARVDMESAVRNKTGGALLIHHHNAAGARGQALTLKDVTCESDDDCTDPWNRYCESLTGVCVGCLETAHCFEGSFCGDLRECETNCARPEANPCSAGAFCEETTGQCVHDCTWEGASACPQGMFCDDGTGWCMFFNPLVQVTDLAQGDPQCPTGGVRVESGLDLNNNGLLDPDEVDHSEIICNPEETPEVLFDTQAASQADCPTGGKEIFAGADDNLDGLLDPDEIDSSWIVCNGDTGTGNGLLVETTDAPESACASGGKTITVGVDADDSGVLEETEIVDSWHVCDPVATPLVQVNEEPPGVNCAAGGQRIETGLDEDFDGLLSVNEIDGTTYVCNGETGETGESGCSTTGSGKAALGLILLLGLVALRRRHRA